MPVVRLDSTDPYLNLATEEHWLSRAADSGPTLLLWRDDPCIVIGRHQNPWVECDLRRMRTDSLPLVRRISGGGAVYHDHGNTNFSFIAPAAQYDQERHFGVVIAALASLGIDAWKSDRNDIRVGDRKISGNAFRHTRGLSLHHGTLLVAADLDRLTSYLTPAAALIETKATASVRSTVMNLTEVRPDLTHAIVGDAIATAYAKAYAAEYGPAAAAPGVGEEAADARTAVLRRAEELAGWDWLYGHTPAFVRRVELRVAGGAGSTMIAVTVRRGVIVSVEGGGSTVGDRLAGIRYDQEAVRAAAPEGADGELIRRLSEAID
jgi:lipoate---protein ligase